jgi:hypothetical protein
MQQNKVCPNCRKEKSVLDFHYKKTEERFSSWCKECLYGFQRRRWSARKIKAIEIMGQKCCKCGYSKNIAALDFHHIDPLTKEMSWTKLRLQPWEDVVKELKKCILVCGNCHAEIHYPQCDINNIKVGQDGHNNNLNREINEISPTGKCPICSVDVYGTKYCSVKCAHFGNRVVKRPSKEVLALEIKNNSWLAISRKYGVSDNAIKKWARRYDLL